MTEKLFITNFCGLRSVELEFAPVTVFIGPQASGKSVIAKTLHHFRKMGPSLARLTLVESSPVATFAKLSVDSFCELFPSSNWGTEPFSIRYEVGTASIKITFSGAAPKHDGELSVDLSKDFEQWSRAEALAPNPEPEVDKKAMIEAMAAQDSQLMSLLGPWSRFQPTFFPAGRAYFAQIQESIWEQLDAGGSYDPILVAFGKLITATRRQLEQQGALQTDAANDAKWREFHNRFSAFLGAQWVKKDNYDCLVSQDGRTVRLASASSGQQEAFSLLLILGQFLGQPPKVGRAVYVEEPEAHLFPATQRAIVELMVRAFRAHPDQMRLVVTTHSPYVLTAFNNFLHAGQCYTNADAAERARLTNIISEEATLRPGELVAYALENGTARRIMDPETGLVDAQLLDAASTDMAKEFDRLLWEGK